MEYERKGGVRHESSIFGLAKPYPEGGYYDIISPKIAIDSQVPFLHFHHPPSTTS